MSSKVIKGATTGSGEPDTPTAEIFSPQVRERGNSGGSATSPKLPGASRPTPGSKKTRDAHHRDLLKDIFLGVLPILVAALAIYHSPHLGGQDPMEALHNVKENVNAAVHKGIEKGIEKAKEAINDHIGSIKSHGRFDEKGFAQLQETWKERFDVEHKDGALTIGMQGCESNDDKSLSDFISALGKLPKFVEELYVKSPLCPSVTGEGLEKFVRVIGKELSGLKKFSLNLSEKKDLTDDHAKKIGDAIKESLPGLTHLDLNFNQVESIKNAGLAHLGESVAHLTGLKQLALKFEMSNGITHEGIQKLLGSLAKGLPDLEDLHLDFARDNFVGEEALAVIGAALETGLQKLKAFFLNVRLSNAVNDAAVKKLMESIGKGQTQLNEFGLRLGQDKQVKNDGINAISESLAKLTALNKVTLELGGLDGVSNEAIVQLIQSISKVSLKHLDLNVHSIKKLLDAPAAVANAINSGKLKNLEHLSLNFVGCDILTSESIRNLTKSIASLTNLEHLALNFMNIKSLSLVEPIEFANMIGPNAQNLKHFELKLLGHHSNDVQGLATLIENLGKYAHNLKVLRLHLLNFSLFTDQMTKDFASILKDKLTKLEELEISLPAHKSVTDDGYVALFTAAAELKELTSFKCIIESGKITDAGIKGLGTALASGFKGLKKISFLFDNIAGITDTGVKDFIEDGLASLHDLNELDITIGRVSITKHVVDRLLNSVEKNQRKLHTLGAVFQGVVGSNVNGEYKVSNLGHIPSVNVFLF